MARKKLFGEILLTMGCLSVQQLDDALQEQGESGLRIGEHLYKQGTITKYDITRALSIQFDFPLVDLSFMEPPENAQDVIDVEMAENFKVVPIYVNNGQVVLAVSDPLDLDIFDRIRFKIGSEVEYVLASDDSIRKALQKIYGIESAADLLDGAEDDEDIDIKITTGDGEADGESGAKDGAIIKMVRHIIAEAVRRKASDIHIEPMMDVLRVRYRIDGVCYDVQSIPKELQASVLARFKIMSGMDIAEKRKPQDGRIKLIIQKREVDFRVSALPAVRGESIVLRILDKDVVMLGVEQLGLHSTDYSEVKRLIKRPNGIILVTGPTGSGKTTTLYAALNDLNSSIRKIITAEDPVEYNISGLNQCQVNKKAGMDFPRILRAMLRQAPNVILVGEIRDLETAEIAIQASLTGHLVFSTLHTNDSPSAITRLVDLGVKPFLVSSSIQAIVAQRLVRRICSDCKQPYDIEPAKLLAIGISEDDINEKTFYHGTGCATCQGVGFKGRTGIYELLIMTPTIKEMTYSGASADELRNQAIREGMKVLMADGARKVVAGVTTVDEVLRQAKTVL